MDDELGALRESAGSPSSGEVCLEVCSRLCFSLPSSVFYHKWIIDLKSQLRDLISEIHFACVAEQQRHLTVNQADFNVLRGCESYHMHQLSGREA